MRLIITDSAPFPDVEINRSHRCTPCSKKKTILFPNLSFPSLPLPLTLSHPPTARHSPKQNFQKPSCHETTCAIHSYSYEHLLCQNASIRPSLLIPPLYPTPASQATSSIIVSNQITYFLRSKLHCSVCVFVPENPYLPPSHVAIRVGL